MEEDKKGKCDACGIIYTKEVYDLSGSNPNKWGLYFACCPRCGYNPNINKDVEELIEISVSAEIKNGKVELNYKELADIIDKEFLDSLKKHAKEKKIFDSMHNFFLQIHPLVCNNLKARFGSGGKLIYNCKELSDLVNKKIIEYWPIPRGKK